MKSMLIYDNSRTNSQRRHSTNSSEFTGRISEAVSEVDIFVNKVKTKWGDEESELRQAIYFQFIKTKSLLTSEFASERSNSDVPLDRSTDEDQKTYGISDDYTAYYKKTTDNNSIMQSSSESKNRCSEKLDEGTDLLFDYYKPPGNPINRSKQHYSAKPKLTDSGKKIYALGSDDDLMPPLRDS